MENKKPTKTVEDALGAADACSARPADKKALGPMFGWALEILASEVRALRELDRGHARVCPQHVKNIDPWVRESALTAKQKQSDAFEEAWKEELGKNSEMKKRIELANMREGRIRIALVLLEFIVRGGDKDKALGIIRTELEFFGGVEAPIQ